MRRIFPLIIVFIPLLLLLLIELSLRLSGFGYDDHLFIDYSELEGYYVANSEISLRYFPPPSPTGFPSDDIFAIEKSDSTIRVFVLGGSTTAGFPYFFNGSFAKHLDDRLAYLYPHYQIEVINLGMTAVNSYTVRDFARQCLDYDPDLIIIYAGHNEFYGALGSASAQASVFGTNRTLTLMYLKIKRLKIYQAIQYLASKLKSEMDVNNTPAQGTLMARMAREKAISISSTLYRNTKAVFQANLENIADWTNQRNVPLLLATLVSNIRDQKPFVSLHTPAADTTGFANDLTQVKRLMLDRQYATALDTLKRMIAINPDYALLYFYAGRCEELLEQYEIAQQYYRRARDLDGLRFRATEDFNDVIRSVANQPGVYLCDLEAGLAKYSSHGLIGKELMLEHLHPNLEGYFQIGQSLAETIIDQNILNQAIPQLPEAIDLPDDDYFRQRIAVTELDLKIAEIQTQILISGWPFTAMDRHLALNDFASANQIEKLALITLRKQINYWQAHQQMADYYMQTNQPEKAEFEAKALIRAFPHHWQTHLRLGKILVNTSQFEKAFPVLESVAARIQEPFSQKWIGSILLNNGGIREAIPYLELALKLEPADHQCRYNLVGAYLLDGQVDKAQTLLDYLLERAPDYPGAQTLFEQVRKLHK